MDARQRACGPSLIHSPLKHGASYSIRSKPSAPKRKAVILIGAQAIYLHAGSIELAVAEYATDADIAI